VQQTAGDERAYQEGRRPDCTELQNQQTTKVAEGEKALDHRKLDTCRVYE